ncbi:MAG: hypothetical protein WA891_19520 [Acidobacteriaceae bacterium]
MNFLMVRRLILKDWYLNRWLILGAVPLGLAALALNLTGSKVASFLSIILICIVVIGAGAQLAVVTTINERKEQTLPFIMSLPVSFREYTAAKVLANLIIFLIPWLIITAGALGVLCLPGAAHALIPFTAIMSAEVLITTCLIIVAGIITESMAWAGAAITFSSLGLNGFGYVFAHTRGISPEMWGTRVQWTGTASAILLAEFSVVALLLGLTFLVQSRKTDFL